MAVVITTRPESALYVITFMFDNANQIPLCGSEAGGEGVDCRGQS
jgi:hypothetical protein